MWLLWVSVSAAALYAAFCAYAAWKWRLLNKMPGPATIPGLGNSVALMSMLEAKTVYAHTKGARFAAGEQDRVKDILFKVGANELVTGCSREDSALNTTLIPFSW